MAKTKVVLNSAGFRELLTSPEIYSSVDEAASSMAQRAGDGYSSDILVGKGRVVAHVFPETRAAQKDNINNNTLLKVMQS